MESGSFRVRLFAWAVLHTVGLLLKNGLIVLALTFGWMATNTLGKLRMANSTDKAPIPLPVGANTLGDTRKAKSTDTGFTLGQTGKPKKAYGKTGDSSDNPTKIFKIFTHFFG